MRYLTVFRAHFWDQSIAKIAERAKSAAPSGEFVVATDETRGSITVEGFEKLPHRDDFSAFSLPALPQGRVLWWNADYVLYAARKARPNFDYYVMLEYDVFVNCDLDRVLAQCAERGVDLVLQDLKRITSENPWFSSISEFDLQPWWALIPFLIVSARAIDMMLQTRQAMAARLAVGEVSNWPYCETFIPTAILQHGDMTFAPLSDFVDTQLLRFRPYLSTMDPQLNQPQSMAHPVLGGANYIRALTGSTPMDALVFPDGRLCHDLQHEDPAELEKEFGAHVVQDHQTKELALVLLPAKKPSLSGLSDVTDLAHRKPASQSSHSKWSRGATITDDAALAVCGILANDYAFHTELEFNPWWQVDLGADSLVEEIEIVNRARPPDRFRSFRIDTSFDGEYWKTQFSKYDNEMVSNDPSKPFLVVFPVSIRARYVRIVQTGHDVMHLRRVRVFGRPLTTEDTTTYTGLNPSDYLATLLSNPTGLQHFTSAVTEVVHTNVLGRTFDSYNVDDLAFLAAGIDSSQYMTAQMSKADRRGNRFQLLDSAASLAQNSGLILEFGVYSGQTVNQLAKLFPERRVYGFDSFEGLPETWRPGFERGAFRRSDRPAVSDNVNLVVGWFDKTLPGFLSEHPGESVAMLHIDCDLYFSTEIVFSQLADQIVPGTIIVFDEYFNYPGWRQHEFRAFQEFVNARGIQYEYVGLVPSNQQVAVKILHVP